MSGQRHPDSLDLLREEDLGLEALFRAWDRCSIDGPTPAERVTPVTGSLRGGTR